MKQYLYQAHMTTHLENGHLRVSHIAAAMYGVPAILTPPELHDIAEQALVEQYGKHAGNEHMLYLVTITFNLEQGELDEPKVFVMHVGPVNPGA